MAYLWINTSSTPASAGVFSFLEVPFMLNHSLLIPLAILFLLSEPTEAETRTDHTAIIGGWSSHMSDNDGEGFNETHNTIGYEYRHLVQDETDPNLEWATGYALMRVTNSYSKPSVIARVSKSMCPNMGNGQFCLGGGLAAATGYKDDLGLSIVPMPGLLLSYTYKGVGIELNHVFFTFTAIQGIVRF